MRPAVSPLPLLLNPRLCSPLPRPSLLQHLLAWLPLPWPTLFQPPPPPSPLFRLLPWPLLLRPQQRPFSLPSLPPYGAPPPSVPRGYSVATSKPQAPRGRGHGRGRARTRPGVSGLFPPRPKAPVQSCTICGQLGHRY